jgi:hypothetical protein
MAILLFAGIFVSLSTFAYAGDMKSRGTMDLAPDGAWAVAMKDKEMADVRGGMGGMSFSVFFTGSVTDLTTTPGGAPDVGDVTVSTGQVQVSNFIASTGSINGVFQFTSVNGSMNVVNNHMTIQIAIFPPGAPTVSTTAIFGIPGL